VVLGGIFLMTAPVGAGVLDASWTAPTQNVDGSPLTDLASYRIYYGTTDSPCRTSSFLQVASPATTPPPGQVVSVRLNQLVTLTRYYVAVSAVDTTGSESACSASASAVAQSSYSVNPTTVDFGSVNVGGFVDRTFTVSNTRGGVVSGTASTSAPFSIVSGSSFSLGGLGASQTVTVRFTPTTSATASVNVSFSADGDSVSRLVTSTGTGSSTSTSTVLSVSPSSVVPGGSVTVSWSGIAAPTSTDWIGLYAAGTAAGTELAWIYVSCSQTPGTATASGSCAGPIPGTVAPGTYELRLFTAGTYTRLATSAPFTVTATTLSVTPSSVRAGSPLTAIWSGIAAPASTDWIGLYAPGTAAGTELAWIYVSCWQTKGTATASGSCDFLIPGTVAPGTYELRLFTAGTYTRIATSNAFSVTR
jgi:hypothetical protein